MSFKISCLLFARNKNSQILLLQRKKAPNKGLWSPPGGKLEMSLGESPVECAKRESFEEMGLELHDRDLQLFGYVSEKNYEGNGHWLMFLFEIIPPSPTYQVQSMREHFNFFPEPRLTVSRFPLQIISWFGLSMTKEGSGSGVFVLILMTKALKLGLKPDLFQRIITNDPWKDFITTLI